MKPFVRIKDFSTHARTSLLSRAYLWLAWGSFLAAAATIVIHLRFVVLPLSLFLLGSVSYLLAGRRSLYLFLFLLPLVNSLPSLFFNGYPFNYMATALFALAGMGAASLLKKERLSFAFPGSRIYFLFLALLWLSVLFVFLRWSNLIYSLPAFFRDTPITPEGQRLSFGVIFPVATLFLFSFSPLLVALVGHHRFSAREALPPLSLGLSLSVGLALVQKTIYPGFLHQKWWMETLGHVNGGFSDYNAFGFFSGLIFLWQAMTLIDEWQTSKAWRRIAAVPFLLTSLAGISLSGCRTALLFVLAAFVYVLFSRKIPLWLRGIFVSTLVILFLVAGGALKTRMHYSLEHLQKLKDSPNLMQGIDNLTFGRVMMIKNSFSLVRRFPLLGVGAGNFLFYLKYDNYKKVYWEDLPLNQYLLILDELGFVGLAVFIVFLLNLAHASTRSQRFLLLGSGLALLFNFFFWFPECMLLFFVLFSANSVKDPPPRLKRNWGTAGIVFLLALSLLGHVLGWRSLDPVNWSKEKGTNHDYGFWYPEKGTTGEFRWSLSSAGIYVFKDHPPRIRLSCAAPLPLLRDGKQAVRIFWRGKFQRIVVFRDNRDVLWEPPAGQSGFLEIRVRPTFNLKAMGRGEEGRDLGVQVYMER